MNANLLKAACLLSPNVCIHYYETITLMEKEKRDLKRLKVSEDKIEELLQTYWKEAITQGNLSNSYYVLNELRKYKSKL